MKKLLLVLLVCVFGVFMASSAIAVPIIDFGSGLLPSGGTITKTGASDLIGTDIPIGSMGVSGAPLNNGTVATSALLNFNTLTGTISIAGNIPSLSITDTLLSGTIVSFILNETTDSLDLTNAKGPDVKSALLLAALGLSADTQWGFFGFSLSGELVSPGVFKAISTDIKNTAVPEPATMLLLGSGLIGLAGFGRRKFFKK